MKKHAAILAAGALAVASAPAGAHSGHGEAGGLAAGLLHPLSGYDHIAAMLLVGVWAAAMAARTRWMLPAAFLCAMVAGFASGIEAWGGVTEAAILLSVVGLGTVAAFRVKAPLPFAVGLVGLFGFAHGMAHGLEAPPGASPALFAAGFLLASSGLHAIGFWLANRIARVRGRVTVAATSGPDGAD